MSDAFEPFELDDDWLDDQLLADDASDPRWKKRSRRGKTIPEVMAGVPKYGQLLVMQKIEPFRLFNRHVEATGVARSVWVREAIADKLEKEGHPPDAVTEWRQ